jgi:hypothetical protein
MKYFFRSRKLLHTSPPFKGPELVGSASASAWVNLRKKVFIPHSRDVADEVVEEGKELSNTN